MSETPPTWSITALAEEYGVTLRTLRHYEDVGLVTPERRGTTRVFHPATGSGCS